MTTNDDDRPPISLAAERKQRERDFGQEREQMVRELLDLGLPAAKATAIANDVLFYDWLIFRCSNILEI